MALLPSFLRNNKKDTRTVGRDYQSIFLIIFTLATLAGIEARLAFLQIFEGHDFHQRADANRIWMIPKHPERGNIFDRNGTVCGLMVLQVLEAYFQQYHPGQYAKPQKQESEVKAIED